MSEKSPFSLALQEHALHKADLPTLSASLTLTDMDLSTTNTTHTTDMEYYS